MALEARIVADIQEAPTESYVQLYNSVNAQLNELAAAAVEFLVAKGFRAVAQPATRPITESDTLTTPLPHKTVATRAGLGWIGKNALLVTERFGTAVRLVSVLTDAPLAVGAPVDVSRCGDCTACVRICPGKAPTGVNWEAGMERARLFDAHACQQASRTLPSNAHLTRRICGRCIPACPHTRRYLKRAGTL